jgi:hypothetical protein
VVLGQDDSLNCHQRFPLPSRTLDHEEQESLDKALAVINRSVMVNDGDAAKLWWLWATQWVGMLQAAACCLHCVCRRYNCWPAVAPKCTKVQQQQQQCTTGLLPPALRLWRVYVADPVYLW